MTLKDLMRFVCACAEQSGHSFTEECAQQIERQIIRAHQGEKVYIPHPDMSLKKDLAEAAKRLPTGIVASRYGVSRSWVHRVIKK